MALFGKPFFTSNEKNTERSYEDGVLCLSKNDFYGADKYFRQAAAAGHTSAFHNLAILNGAGYISPYDVDFAADCYYKAAAAGHPTAKEQIFWLEAADRAGLGTDNLSTFASKLPADQGLNHILMMAGCRFYGALCKNYGEANEVIEYELDAASLSDYAFIQNFVRRTGVPVSNFKGGLNRLKTGSAADQITDGLNALYIGLKQSGHSDQICLMTRCTIVGYIVSKSMYSDRSSQLLGIDKFFA